MSIDGVQLQSARFGLNHAPQFGFTRENVEYADRFAETMATWSARRTIGEVGQNYIPFLNNSAGQRKSIYENTTGTPTQSLHSWASKKNYTSYRDLLGLDDKRLSSISQDRKSTRLNSSHT